jgi:hypothetical protein
MRRLLLPAAAGLCLASLLGVGAARAADKDKDPFEKPKASCGSFGTSVEFVDTPSEAAKVAKKQEKLVLVLHVSGNFEDPRFT